MLNNITEWSNNPSAYRIVVTMNQRRETDTPSLPGNRVHLSPATPPPPDGTTPKRSRQCKSVSIVQRRCRRPPGRQLTAGRPVALTAPPGRAVLNMKK